MCDFSGLSQNDTLQQFYDKHNSRLPVDDIPRDIGESKDDKALTKCCKSEVIYSDKHKENVCRCCGMGV